MAKRENSSGSIVRRKRASGFIYEAFTPAQYTCNEFGRMVYQRELIGRFPKRADARQALDNYIRHPTTKYNFTLRELYEEWKEFSFKNISKQTQDNYTAAWAKICACDRPRLPDKMLREITTGELRILLDVLQQPHRLLDLERGSYILDKETKEPKLFPPLSRSYITKIKALLTQLYSYGMENNIVDKNYAALVKLTRQTANKKRSFTDLEFSVLEKGWQTVPGGDAVYALCYLGFRVTEFCELTHFSYDPKAQLLTGGLKTDAGRDRVVPVHKKIRPIIQEWYDRGCDALYADANGKPYNKDKFLRRVWRPALDALGLPDDLTPHSARHTCATRLAAAGARTEDIKNILGHEDYALTANTYINQDTKALIEAMDLLA